MRSELEPGAYIDGCDPTTPPTTTTTTMTSTTTTLAIDPKISPQITPTFTPAPIIQTTPTPIALGPIVADAPELSFWDEVVKGWVEQPLALSILTGLCYFYLTLFLISCCCKLVAKKLDKTSPGQHPKCIHCLKITAKYTEFVSTIVAAVIRGIESLRVRPGDVSQQHEMRDYKRLLPRSNRDDGPITDQPTGDSLV